MDEMRVNGIDVRVIDMRVIDDDDDDDDDDDEHEPQHEQ